MGGTTKETFEAIKCAMIAPSSTQRMIVPFGVTIVSFKENILAYALIRAGAHHRGRRLVT